MPQTTTSSMVAHILHQSGKNVAAFIGGIANNFASNVLIPQTIDEQTIIVVEADEYDRSFLNLYPDVAILTAMDPDHLDIYKEEKELKAAFSEFIYQIKENGLLVKKEGLPVEASHAKEFTYGLGMGDGQAINIRPYQGRFYFDYYSKMHQITGIGLKVPGYHNVENALASIITALSLDIGSSGIKEALNEYTGVKRRFDFILHDEDRVFIDDYAHHPEEIKALLRSVRQLFPGKKITAVFQPHLFSRTRDFADGFAESLGMADELILLDIYPAREEPIAGVSSQMILDKVNIADKKLVSKSELPVLIQGKNPEVLLTIGAGDVDKLVPELKESLLKKNLIEV